MSAEMTCLKCGAVKSGDLDVVLEWDKTHRVLCPDGEGKHAPTTAEIRTGYIGEPEHFMDKAVGEEFDRWLAAHDAEVRAATITEFESLYFGPGSQTREWVANTMRGRHGLPPRPGIEVRHGPAGD